MQPILPHKGVALGLWHMAFGQQHPQTASGVIVAWTIGLAHSVAFITAMLDDEPLTYDRPACLLLLQSRDMLACIFVMLNAVSMLFAGCPAGYTAGNDAGRTTHIWTSSGRP